MTAHSVVLLTCYFLCLEAVWAPSESTRSVRQLSCPVSKASSRKGGRCNGMHPTAHFSVAQRDADTKSDKLSE